MGSLRFQLSQEDVQKIVKGALVALAGAGVVWLGQMATMDFGAWTPWIVALTGTGVNALRKWVADNSK